MADVAAATTAGVPAAGGNGGATITEMNTSSKTTASEVMGAFQGMNEDNVASWLQEVGLDKYQHVFKRNDVTGSVLVEMDDVLMQEMGLPQPDRIRFFHARSKGIPIGNTNQHSSSPLTMFMSSEKNIIEEDGEGGEEEVSNVNVAAESMSDQHSTDRDEVSSNNILLVIHKPVLREEGGVTSTKESALVNGDIVENRTNSHDEEEPLHALNSTDYLSADDTLDVENFDENCDGTVSPVIETIISAVASEDDLDFNDDIFGVDIAVVQKDCIDDEEKLVEATSPKADQVPFVSSVVELAVEKNDFSTVAVDESTEMSLSSDLKESIPDAADVVSSAPKVVLRNREDQIQNVRKKTWERYKIGRDQVIEDWEDPTFPLYAKTDRYGFIRDTEMKPNPVTANKKRAEKLLELERTRALKWSAMLSGGDEWWGNGTALSMNHVKYKKMRSRVYKGVPDSVRGLVWQRLLRSKELCEQGLYKKLIHDAELGGEHSHQIDLDINRTFRDHILFRDRYGDKQRQLFFVLQAYSLHDPEVGYCQGMAGIAALLLMYMGDEDAFWSMVALFGGNRHSLHAVYLPGFPRLLDRFSMYEEMLREVLPGLHEHFEKESVMTSAYATKWFLQAYLNKEDFHVCLRIWDIFMLDGYNVVMCVALALLKTHKDRLFAMSFEGIVEFLLNIFEREDHDEQQLIDGVAKLLNRMQGRHLDHPSQQ